MGISYVDRNGEIFFEDDTFTVNKKRAMQIWRRFLREV